MKNEINDNAENAPLVTLRGKSTSTPMPRQRPNLCKLASDSSAVAHLADATQSTCCSSPFEGPFFDPSRRDSMFGAHASFLLRALPQATPPLLIMQRVQSCRHHL